LTTAPSGKSARENGLELAAAGRLGDALACFREHLLQNPDHAETLNDAGTVLYALGRFQEAAQHLRQACELLGSQATPARVNLAEALLAGGDPVGALAVLEDLAEENALAPDLAVRTAMQLLERHHKAGAMSALLHSHAVAPRQEGIAGILDQLRSGRPKIALLAGDDPLENFGDVRAMIAARFPARSAQFSPDTDVERMKGAIEWCDIAWVDGCVPLLAMLAGDENRRRLVCRLSPREAAHPLCDRVCWERVDVLLVHGGPAAREAILGSAPLSHKAKRIVELPPSLDVASIPAGLRAPGRTLAWATAGQEAEGLALLLQCFAELHRREPLCRLHIAGVFQDGPRGLQYLDHMARRMGLTDAIVLDGWQEDLPLWLRDKHFLVCTRLWDQRRLDILGAMAAGVRPLVHAFPGSEEFVPPECLFDTVEEFCSLVRQGPAAATDLRPYVARRFSLRRQLRSIDGLLGELESELEVAAAPPKMDVTA
jgi:glycosyltransferase involved in cell wall biosynthesis